MHPKVEHYAGGATVIKRIELVNFMSHKRTVIEPAAGLTVLVGPNNCGKSAFVSALQVLCHNAKSSYVMRHGEKQCEVIVETDDGHIVRWHKKKSGGAKYVIDGQEYDRLRQGIPEQLHQILKLSKVDCDTVQYDIHFGEQKSPVFLLNDSGKAAAQFFASSSDAIRLVEMQSTHKNQMRDAKRDQARLNAEREELLEAREALEPLADLEKQIAATETQFQEIHLAAEKIEHVQILISALSEVTAELGLYNAQAISLLSLVEPPEFSDSKTLDRLVAALRASNLEFEIASASSTAFSKLKTPPKVENETELFRQIENLRSAGRKFGYAAEVASAFGSLKSPPEIQDESKFVVALEQLVEAQQKTVALQKLSGLLSGLCSPPEIVDFKPLEQTLGEMSKLENSIAAATRNLKQIQSDVESLSEEVEAWVALNPTCPTCGSETVVDQVIGAGMGGGHRHG